MAAIGAEQKLVSEIVRVRFCPNPDFTPAAQIAVNGSLERYGPKSTNGISVSSVTRHGRETAALMLTLLVAERGEPI